jgi:DNA-binding beta-propeller fold protein YncE
MLSMQDVHALPRTKEVVVSGGHRMGRYAHSLVFIDGTTFAVTHVVQVGNEPGEIGFNTATGHIYVANFFSNNVGVVGD